MSDTSATATNASPAALNNASAAAFVFRGFFAFFLFQFHSKCEHQEPYPHYSRYAIHLL